MESGVRDVKSAARTVELLELLAGRQNRPTSIRELSEAMNVPRSSLHALLRTLAKHGWVSGDSSGSLYRIGIRALLAGTSYLDADPYLPIVQTYLDELHAQFDETFHFGRLDGFDMVYLSTRESSRYSRPLSRVGRRLPAYATSLGKAVLAERTGADRSRHIPTDAARLTPHTLAVRADLDRDLEQTRARGFAIDNEENTPGLRCFAVALPYADPASDAISVSLPLAGLAPAREAEVISALRLAGQKVCRIVRPIKDAAWI
ncbi:IclR family transcriptional regulator [Cryobacterium melibiosiphilum]|uniref:Glycerol operon regulatory protein n=2 Tax=Cryobacterium melibiosiphilum TaxID=995039 RepID=A0A3A5MKA2_9MICO|nr:IclR family transcriptional regulator [Cryobacterium melibiosiphilum]